MAKSGTDRLQSIERPARLRMAMFVGLLAVVAGGVGYRVIAHELDAARSAQIQLERPIATLPLRLGDWSGQEVEVPVGILRIAGNDDTVSRLYRRTGGDATVSLYIGYTGRPGTMLGHRPTICYPNAGHALVGSESVTIESAGRKASVMLHSFLKPGVPDERTLVLHYYVLNGEITVDEDSFWGLKWRTPNLSRDATRYVAQVQIATSIGLDIAGSRRQALEFARESMPAILELLP